MQLDRLESRRLHSGETVHFYVVYNTTSGSYWNTGNGQFVEKAHVFIDLNKNSKLDRNEPQQTTNAQGLATFKNVKTGLYSAGVLPLGYPYIEKDAVFQSFITPLYSQKTGIYEEQLARLTKDVPSTNELAGYVYSDKDRSGDATDRLYDPDVGLPGVLVYLDANDNGRFDKGEISSTSKSDGSFAVQGYTYFDVGKTVRVSLPSGQSATTSAAFEVTAFNRDVKVFVFDRRIPTATVNVEVQSWDPPSDEEKRDFRVRDGIRVYVDLDRNGKRDRNEPSVISSSSESKAFHLSPGKYQLRLSLPTGYETDHLFSEFRIADRQTMKYTFHLTPIQTLNIAFYVDKNHDHKRQGREHYVQWNTHFVALLSNSTPIFFMDLRFVADNLEHVIHIKNLTPTAMQIPHEGYSTDFPGPMSTYELKRGWKDGTTIEFALEE